MAHLNLCTLFAANLPVCDVRTLIYITNSWDHPRRTPPPLRMNLLDATDNYEEAEGALISTLARYKPPPYPRQSMCRAVRDDSCLTEDKVLLEAFTNTCAFAPLAVLL